MMAEQEKPPEDFVARWIADKAEDKNLNQAVVAAIKSFRESGASEQSLVTALTKLEAKDVAN